MSQKPGTAISPLARVVFLLLCVGSLRAQSTDLMVKSFRYEGPAIGALLQIGSDAKLPLGVICGVTAALENPVNLNRDNATVDMLVDAVLAYVPGYQWRMDTAVLHVFPKTATTAESAALTLRIPKVYSASSAPEVVAASLRAAADAELNPRPTPSGGVVSILSTPVENDKPLSMQNATVEQILDTAATRSSGIAAWVMPPQVSDLRTTMRSRPPWHLASYPSLLRMSATLCAVTH